MARTATARRIPAEAPLTTSEHDNIFRDWLKARTRQVFDEPAYTPATRLYEDHQAWAAATIGADKVMSEAQFGHLLAVWPHHLVKMLPVQRALADDAKLKLCANLRLFPAMRAIG